jgi:hypothetical protein
MTAHEHAFSYDNDHRPGQRSLCCACGVYLSQHAPGHPIGVQPGPNGMYARFCLVPGCDWRETKGLADAGRVEAGALAATFLFCVVLISLFALAVIGSRAGLCKADPMGHSYCKQWKEAAPGGEPR